MTDIFRDLSLQQKKDIIQVPKKYHAPIVRTGAFGRKEEQVGTILLRVVHEICERNIKHHKENHETISY